MEQNARKIGFFLMIGIALGVKAQDDNYFTMSTVQLIQERYYLVKRLEYPAELLINLYEHKLSDEVRNWQLPPDIEQEFAHPVVRKALLEIAKPSALILFKKIWCNFLSYRYLGDELFVRETIKLLLLLYKNKIDFSHQIKNPFLRNSNENMLDVLIEKPVSQPPQDEIGILATNHDGADNVCKGDCGTINDTISAIEDLSVDQKDNIVINNIMRFYHMQRLTKAIFILSKKDEAASFAGIDQCYEYKHEIIKSCVAEIIKTANLRPLLRLWARLRRYEFICDKLLLYEFIYLTASLELMLIKKQDQKPPIREGSTFSNILDMYGKITNLPILDLLNLLDDITDQYESITHNYELQNNKLTWSSWFKKYWWAPPVVVASAVIFYVKNNKIIAKILAKISS